jgi:hypothetical protein
MSDEMELGNLTLAQIREFRALLLARCLFEPVTDPGFKRVPEKLGALIAQAESFIDRLRANIAVFDEFLDLCKKLRNTIESGGKTLDELTAEARKMPDVGSISSVLLGASLPQSESEKYQKKQALRNVVWLEATQIWNSFTQSQAQLSLLELGAVSAQFNAAQLWLFLDRMTQAISAGSKQVFHSSSLPIDLNELATDSMDFVLDKAALPPVTPVLHVLQAFMGFLRRDRDYEELIDKQWTDTEKSIFLSLYFKWWSQEGGERQVNVSVTACEELFPKYQEATSSLALAHKDTWELVDKFVTHAKGHDSL